jgi:flagellin
MISIQTNYASMVGANNLDVNNTFQTKTIEALTSGYRINSSGDDPAGLAVANQYAANVSQLTQGIINANSGVSTLQIIDGGMSNISAMLDRMQSLASESASGTFAGNRATVNSEFQTLQAEIDREANNIGLGTSNNSNVGTLSVYIGGGSGSSGLANSQVQIQNLVQVDANSLGVGTGVDVLGAMQSTGQGASGAVGNVAMTGSGALLVNTSQSFAFTGVGSTGASTVTATVAGGSAGITGQQALQSLNAQLNPYGIQATSDANGNLEFESGLWERFHCDLGGSRRRNRSRRGRRDNVRDHRYRRHGGCSGCCQCYQHRHHESRHRAGRGGRR